jgi:predicted acyl esterase
MITALTPRRRWATLTAAAAIATVLPLGAAHNAGAGRANTAGAPTDYRKVHGLSKPVYPKTVRNTFDVPMHDDINLYVEATYPDPKKYGKKGWPVIMEVSPYHGTLADREGTRIFPDPTEESQMIGLTGYFAPRGYAVVMVDLRGTGRSEGCLDHLGPNDAKDLKTIIEWAAKQSWSNGKVGLTGHSYVGSTPSIAAAQNPKGLVTIAPSAGLASMYDHQFQYGVPYNLQWAGPIFAYEQLSVERHLPGEDNAGQDMQYFGCGAANSAATAGHGQITGQYQQWHADRDWGEGATKADIPIFIIHGVNDNAARIPAAEWFFGRRFGRPDDKVWLGQWQHGSGGNAVCGVAHPNCRFKQWQYALHAWFDKQLQGRNVDTGPSVEVFLNDGQVLTDDAWNRPEDSVVFHADATDNKLESSKPTDEGSVTFNGATNETAEFTSAPFKKDAVFVGLPHLQLDLSLTGGQVVHIVTTLSRQSKGGTLSPMNYCAIEPQLRDGVDTVAPVVPLEVMDLEPQCFTVAHHVEKGDKLVLSVGTTSPHHVSFGKDVQITVHTGPDGTSYELPIVPNPVLYPDVPLGRPQ